MLFGWENFEMEKGKDTIMVKLIPASLSEFEQDRPENIECL